MFLAPSYMGFLYEVWFDRHYRYTSQASTPYSRLGDYQLFTTSGPCGGNNIRTHSKYSPDFGDGIAMALSVRKSLDEYPPVPDSACAPRNDAFAFWKLPMELATGLAASTDYSESIIRRYLFEEYLSEQQRKPSRLLNYYYLFKAIIPVALRHRINAIAVHSRRPLEFPHWPCETALLDYLRQWVNQSLLSLGLDDVPHISFWPDGHRCCIVLTHDVESLVGFDRIERMADLEEKYGFRSALNFPLKQYPLDWRRLEALKRRGFEFGAHGLAHDGRLFRSEADFNELAPLLEQLARERDFRGFRSPSTLRRVEWLSRMAFDFDCSLADTDPFEPQPGGSCSVFPFFLGHMVELPYTLAQDHTLIHLLRKDPLPVWTAKLHWIASIGGMILTLTHPDYSGVEPHISRYETLLKRLSEVPGAWRALPSEVASWWRQRSAMALTMRNGVPVVSGAGCQRAVARQLGDEPLAKWEHGQ